MIFEIVNTVLLLFSLVLNIKILNIANKIQQPQKVSLADMAADMMSCDNCDNCDARDSHEENNVSLRNIYMVGTDNENDNTILLENNLTDQLSKQSKNKEWTEIKIDK
jgi:uncharacterized protein (UPF0179 family)